MKRSILLDILILFPVEHIVTNKDEYFYTAFAIQTTITPAFPSSEAN
jgi:hypothetical protein